MRHQKETSHRQNKTWIRLMAEIYVLKRTVDSGQKQRIKNSLDDNLCDRNLVHI